ncbi:hypothetical protein ACJX0J_011837, partial [Zea mays]
TITVSTHARTTENLSVIHAFDGESFERWYINQEPRKRRLSDAHELTTSNIYGVQQYWEQQRYLRKKIWLQTWLRREIEALRPCSFDPKTISTIFRCHQILHEEARKGAHVVKDDFSREDAARPFLLGRTRRRGGGELFLASDLNMEAYNKLRVQRFR